VRPQRTGGPVEQPIAEVAELVPAVRDRVSCQRGQIGAAGQRSKQRRLVAGPVPVTEQGGGKATDCTSRAVAGLRSSTPNALVERPRAARPDRHVLEAVDHSSRKQIDHQLLPVKEVGVPREVLLVSPLQGTPETWTCRCRVGRDAAEGGHLDLLRRRTPLRTERLRAR